MLNKILPLGENDLFLLWRHGTDMLLDRSRGTIRAQTLALQPLMDQARKIMLIKRNTSLWSNKDFFGIFMKKDSYFIFLYLKVRRLLCHITKTKLVKDNRSDSPYMFWQEPLNLLLKSLGPILSKVSAVPVPGYTTYWGRFWPWKTDLASWFDFRPAWSLQACLVILTLSWSQLLSLDLFCPHCWGAAGLGCWEPCPACFAAVLSSWLAFLYWAAHSPVPWHLGSFCVCVVTCV